MRNSLMVYRWWNACVSVLRWLFSPLQRGHAEGRRPGAQHRRDAFKQREARRRFDGADAEQPGSPVPDRVRRLCHG